MALAQKGIDVRQTGTSLVFRAFLQTSAGALLGTGTTTLSIVEIQSDGTIKSYDFNDNTFKTTALTTATLALTHRPSNNAGTTTGLWTVALNTVSGFTVGGIYVVFVNNTGASPTDQAREFQYGGAEGDLAVTAGATGVAYLQDDARFHLGTVLPTPATAGTPDVNLKNAGNVAWNSAAISQNCFNVDTGLRPIYSGTAQGGTTLTLTLDSAANAIDDYYKGMILRLIGGAGAGTGGGQIRLIKSYVGSTKVATVHSDWKATPDNTTTYVIHPAGPADIELINAQAVIASATITVGAYIGNATAALSVNASGQPTSLLDFTQALPAAPAANSLGEALYASDIQLGRIGTCQAGSTSTTIKLDSGASSVNGRYIGYGVYLYGGTGGGVRGTGQQRTIVAYNGTTKVATVDSAWATTPDNSTTYMLQPTPLSMVYAIQDVASGDYHQLGVEPSFGGVYSADGSISTATFAAGALGNSLLGSDFPFKPIRTGTCQSGSGASSIKLDSGASSVDDFYKDTWVITTGGTGSGQARLVTSYTGTSKQAAIDPPWKTVPDNTTTFSVLPVTAVDVRTWFGSTTPTVQANVVSIFGDGDAAAGLAASIKGLYCICGLARSTTSCDLSFSNNPPANSIVGWTIRRADAADLGSATITSWDGATAVWSPALPVAPGEDDGFFLTPQVTLARVQQNQVEYKNSVLYDQAVTYSGDVTYFGALGLGSATITMPNEWLTDDQIATPAEASGRPSTVLGMVRRIFELIPGGNERDRDRDTGIVSLKGENGITVLVTWLQSTTGNVDTEGKAA